MAESWPPTTSLCMKLTVTDSLMQTAIPRIASTEGERPDADHMVFFRPALLCRRGVLPAIISYHEETLTDFQ